MRDNRPDRDSDFQNRLNNSERKKDNSDAVLLQELHCHLITDEVWYAIKKTNQNDQKCLIAAAAAAAATTTTTTTTIIIIKQKPRPQ